MSSREPSTLSVDEFLSRIVETLRPDSHNPPFTLIVGGGFSHGVIPVSREMIPMIPQWVHKEVNSLDAESEFEKRFWAKLSKERDFQLVENGLPELRSGDHVSRVYTAAMLQGLPTPYLRRKFFRGLCRNAEHRINLAHLYLASILHAQDTDEWKNRGYSRFCSTIFTTNFDPLLQIALQLVSKLYYMTDRPQTLETPHDEENDAIHLIYTHGSIHQAALANTKQEIRRFANLQARQLPGYFRRHGVIVIGYSGWIDSCMTALTQCDQFDHNLYWCDICRGDSAKTSLRQNVYKFLVNHADNAFYVRIDSADSIMQQIHEALKLGIAPSMISNPLPPLLDRFRQIRFPTDA
ncbi:MAG: SIR2 family protein [Candidatus Binatia bacterium]